MEGNLKFIHSPVAVVGKAVLGVEGPVLYCPCPAVMCPLLPASQPLPFLQHAPYLYPLCLCLSPAPCPYMPAPHAPCGLPSAAALIWLWGSQQSGRSGSSSQVDWVKAGGMGAGTESKEEKEKLSRGQAVQYPPHSLPSPFPCQTSHPGLGK